MVIPIGGQSLSSIKQLVEFARVVVGFTLIVCAISYYRHGELSYFAKTLSLVGLCIGVSGVVYPQSLNWLFEKWLLLGEKLAIVVSKVVVLITFFLVITPVGLLLKLMRKDLLETKFDRETMTSYFSKPDHAVAERHDAPF